MFRRLTSRKSRRSLPPTPVRIAEPDAESLEALYGGQLPCYDHGANSYGDQLLLLFAGLNESCDDLNVHVPSENGDMNDLDRLCGHLIGDHFHGQTALFFQSMKKNLEHLLFLLRNPAIESARKVTALEELMPNLLHCGAGLHSHLLVCISKLMTNLSIDKWLADLRRDIIYDIACQQVIAFDISIGSEIHVFNAFMRYAQLQGWQPAGAAEIEQVKDAHIDNIRSKIKYNEFAASYLATYIPSAMIRYVATQLATTVRQLLEKEFIVKDNVLDFHENDYNIVVSRLAMFKHFGNIDDLLDFSEDYRYARIKADRELCGLMARLCIAQQLFTPVKYLQTKAGHTMTIIMQPKPQTVLIDDVMDNDATQFFCEHPELWPQIHFKFARYLFKKTAMPIEVYRYYRAHGQRHFNKLNLTHVFASAAHAVDVPLVQELLRGKIDLSIRNAEGLLPLVCLASNGDWPILMLIAQKIKRSHFAEIGLDEALLFAVKDNELQYVKDLVALGVYPLNACMAETGNNAFHLAITHRRLVIMSYLLSIAKPIGMNKKGFTPIAMAAAIEEWEMVHLIATAYPADVGDVYGYTRALLLAVAKNKTEIACLLSACTISIEKLNRLAYNEENNYVLHLAVINNNPEVIRALLVTRASINVRNKDKLTPVQLAATLGHVDLITIFAEFHYIDYEALDPYLTYANDPDVPVLTCTIN